MARCVFLHIGTMKAATTYLQYLFDANRDLLASHGLLWQGARFNQYAIHDLHSSSMLPEAEKGAFLEFRDQVRREPGDVLVSMELLAKQPAKRARRLARELGADSYVVIVTARDVARTARSHWQESTQNRSSTPWAQWIAEICAAEPGAGDSKFWRNHYLPRIIDEWAEVAAPGATRLVTIPPPGAARDVVWHRFASALGVPPDGAVMPAVNNSGLGGVSAELMRRLNGQLTGLSFDEYRWGFKAALAKQTLSRRAALEPPIALSPQQHDRLAQVAGEMVDHLKQRSDVVEVIGDLTDLLPGPRPEASSYDPVAATDSELLDAALAGLLGLGRRVSRQHEELRQARAELASLARSNEELRAELERRSSQPVRQALRDISTRRLGRSD